MVSVCAAGGAVYTPELALMPPLPVLEAMLQVTALHETGELVTLLHVPLITALTGTPVTVTENGRISPVPTVAAAGFTDKRTPESRVTVVVPLALPWVAVMVIVVLAGTTAGAV